jgi:hypothetical protein
MQHSVPQSALLCLLWSFPALDHLGLLRCIFSLAVLETRQYESLLARQGLLPLDPSARSQFRAICQKQDLSSYQPCCRFLGVLCASKEFLVYLCRSAFLLQAALRFITALARARGNPWNTVTVA